MINRTKIIFDACINYLSKEWSIIPVGLDKKPLIPWKEFQDRRATEDDVLGWLKKFPQMNIGLVCGKISGIIALDFDIGHEKETNPNLFPETLTFQTPSGGTHKVFRYTEGFTVSANAYKEYPYMDVRSDSGFIVVYPSITNYKDKTGKQKGGEYTILKNLPLAPFPIHLFPKTKKKKTIIEKMTATKGSRNDNLTSFIGQLLQAEPNEDKWFTDVLPASQIANKSYASPLPDKEVLTIFNSIAKKEKARREKLNIVVAEEEGVKTTINLSRNKSNTPYANMANVVSILEAHPNFREKIKYNTFRQEIELDGVPMEDNDIIKVQYLLQTTCGLPTITKEAVYSALVHCAYENRYDEAIDWLTSLKWDGEERLFMWLTTAIGVEDNAYNRGVGAQWFIQIVDRIMNPGCRADYMLVLVGKQGIGKSSLFQILGGKHYKVFSGSVENKDFFLVLRGALIIDLDEGATLYKAESIKMKTIVTQREDEFRAPYDRVPKKFPRRFVFSMSTNAIEPFRDETGNRRYWAVDMPDQMVNFKWLEDNREQLFAEALHWLKDKDNPEIVPQVPKDEAEIIQQNHLPDDTWSDLICDEVRKSYEYCEGSENYSTTIQDVFLKVFANESAIRLDRKIEMRISSIFKNQLGLVKVRKMVDGEQRNRWVISPNKIKKLQKKNLPVKETPLDEFVEELKQQGKLSKDF